MRQRPDVAPDRVLVVGQSFGGASTVALAAMNPPGVVAAINFAGGSGGDPKGRPKTPARSLRWAHLSDLRCAGQVPMLWIYTENDMYFGPRIAAPVACRVHQGGGQGGLCAVPSAW